MPLARELRAKEVARAVMAATKNPSAFAASRKTGIKQSAVLHPKAAAANYFTLNSPLAPVKGRQAGEPIDRRC